MTGTEERAAGRADEPLTVDGEGRRKEVYCVASALLKEGRRVSSRFAHPVHHITDHREECRGAVNQAFERRASGTDVLYGKSDLTLYMRA